MAVKPGLALTSAVNVHTVSVVTDTYYWLITLPLGDDDDDDDDKQPVCNSQKKGPGTGPGRPVGRPVI